MAQAVLVEQNRLTAARRDAQIARFEEGELERTKLIRAIAVQAGVPDAAIHRAAAEAVAETRVRHALRTASHP